MNTDARQHALVLWLRQHGPASARAIATALGVSQPTVSRLIQRTPEVIAMGQARATRYALAHTLGREGSRWPLYRLDANARPERLGELQALHGGGFHFQPDQPLPAFTHGDFHSGLYPGLPWFLDDLRPQGFLGRAFARRVASQIGAVPDLNLWRSDDIVRALLHFGGDLPGDLILGDEALQAAMRAVLQATHVIDAADAAAAFAGLAENALRGEVIGSSAGGEQPKFTATVREADGQPYPSIVKFSEHRDSAAGRRWADLLACEQLAAQLLQQYGIPASHTRLLHHQGRTFLQVRRFDRSPNGGRYGFVSLAAVDAAFYGHGRIDWWRFADELHGDGWLSANDARKLRIIGWFGALIGNSDMHPGNAGLMLGNNRPLALAPVYDMLPMLWRPSAHGEVVARDFQIALPSPQHLEDWRLAAQMALAFWQQAQALAPLSPDFHQIAAICETRLHQAITRFG
ncbi:MAG: type II toxin-antitoxin system HipA family toxin YjjJ [Pseudomonadota bacterium]|nr:type II toxin-antitoxin system HipA family toxin YjjJ [Pseudomonadota bacterium]